MATFPDLQPGKHLVLDNHSIADTYLLDHEVHRPRRDPAGPVLEPMRPWEGSAVVVTKVIRDEPSGEWRMWYTAYDAAAEETRKKLGASQYGNVGPPQPSYLCYATSRDGVTWDRPPLGIYGDTNICFKGYSGVYGGTVIHRPDAAPAERFALVNCEWRSMEVGGIYLAYSPDGIHWSYPPGTDKPLIHGESDCNNGCVYNPQRKVYMLYMRAWHSAAVGWVTQWPLTGGTKNTRRRVTYSESPDLRTWTEPQVIITPDELDTNDFYGFSPFRYGDLFLGQLWIHDDDDRETIDIELAWSRDGVRWSRHPRRPKFITAGEKGDIDGYMVWPAQEPVVGDDALYFYVNAHAGMPHDFPLDAAYRSVCHRGRLRLDGFVSLNAGRQRGCLITRPFTLRGKHVTINAATQTGRIDAEIVEPYWHDPEGKTIAGYSAAEFDVFTGDAVAHRLSWRGRDDLSPLIGRRVMLRMAMTHAQVYSITI